MKNLRLLLGFFVGIHLIPPSIEGQTTFTRVTQGDLVEVAHISFGSSWADYDLDGFVDLFVSGIGENQLFRNLGNGEFEGIDTENPIVLDDADTNAGVWGDFDNDGDLDLFVSNFIEPSQDRLYRNDGVAGFQNITAASLPVDDLHGIGAAWVDLDLDGHLDLYVANGDGRTIQKDAVYHNQGDGTFESLRNAITDSNVQTQSGTWSDYDNDGDPDLFVGTLVGDDDPWVPNLLFRNDGELGFQHLMAEDVGDLVGRIRDTSSGAWGDLNNDGRVDLAIPGSARGASYIYIQVADGRFVESSLPMPNHGVGVSAVDYDNDGNLDLFLTANGAAPNTNALFHNDGSGTFSRVTEGNIVTDSGESWSCSWGDYDNDGFLDLFVANNRRSGSDFIGARNFLYHNDGNDNHWILIKLEGTFSNRSAIGAKVRIKATIGGKEMWQMREISGGSGWCSQNDLRAHFGLGDATMIDTLRIEWPSGMVQEMHSVAADQILPITEAPMLEIELAVILSWPAVAQDHVLEAAGSVDGPWEPVDGVLALQDGKITTAVKVSEQIRFFRLRMP